jgi:hypothetical protein
MARGGHGLPKVSLGPDMPYLSMLCGWSPLKQSYGRFGGARLQDRLAVAIFHPLGHPIPYAHD